MKKQIITALALALTFVICLTACGQTSTSGNTGSTSQNDITPEDKEWSFDRRIEIMVPSPEGSNADITIRKFTELLSEELGVDVMTTNMAGASGVTGYTWARDQVHDGYFFQYTSPSAIGSAVLGNFDFNFFDEITPLAGLLDASNVIFAGKDAPFSNYDELVAYAKANPGKVSIAVQSTTGIDGASMGQFLAKCGYELNMINYESEAVVSCISGQVDLIMNSYGECEAYVESGDLVPIILLDSVRLDKIPDVPCSADVGLDATLGPWFGFTCFNETPQEAQDAFVAAVMKCAQDPEWKEFLTNLGYDASFACDSATFTAALNNTANTMKEAFAYFEDASK